MPRPTGKLGALYKCFKCGYEWTDRAGPVVCPRCGYLWIKWLNYDEMFGKPGLA